MGLNLIISAQQFANQFNNGEDLNSSLIPANTTSYLAGNSGELLKNSIEFKISWTSQSTAITDIFTINGNTLSRSGSGDFELDSFKIGDIIDIWELTPLGVVVQDRTITGITASTIDFDGAGLGLTTLTDGIVYGKTPLENIIFNYNLIENSEAINFISKIDGTAENEFFASGVGIDLGGGVRDTSIITMTKATGVNSWKTAEGLATIAYQTTGNQSDSFAQVFDIVHIFRLFPYYLDGWLPNLQTLAPPFPEWQASNCLKYVSQIELRQTLNDPNTSRKNDFSSIQGNTGWLDENFNGFTNNFSVQSLDITSNTTGTTLTALDYQESCHVVVVLFSDNNVFLGDGSEVVGCISYLPPQLNYQQNSDTINDNFLFDSVYTSRFEIPKSSTILKNFDITASSVTGDTMTVEFDVEYNPAQQALLQNQRYMIFLGTGDQTLLAPASDRVMLLADLNEYTFNLDVPDLIFMDNFNFVPHSESDISVSLPNDYKGWIEDGFQIQAPFKLNTDIGSFLTSLSVDIVAFNEDNNQQFLLQTTNIDLSSAVISMGVQQINVNSTNNFLIDPTSDFKKIDCVNAGSGTHGGINVELYDTKIGVRFNFEEWIALLTANSQYFDATQLNNGLNLLTSNYSTRITFPAPDNYEIRAQLKATVNDGSGTLTDYLFLSNPLKAYYYDLDGRRNPHWVCNIETFDTTGVLIDVILSDNYTDIKATFTKNPAAFPVPDDLVGAWGWLRLDVQQGTINTPYQISTIYNPIASSPLIPLPTETKCKLTNLGGTVLLEARIDDALIPSGSVLSITARLSGGEAETTWELYDCEGGITWYTSTDLSLYIGDYIYIDSNNHCFQVIGVSTNIANYPNEPVIVWGSGYEDCSACFGSQKLTESGSQKYEENGTNKIIE
tara:strand:- start:476 stop:3166 length:2691 start_codon:yes stop_codon:yes gene_type:complete